MLTSRRLLIVEDVFLIALEIQRIAEDGDAAHAVFARNFHEAAALADGFAEFDLAIVNPPAPDELATAEKLHAAGTAIVLCSAAPVDLLATPFRDAAFISKPFSDEQLLAACQAALARRAARNLGW